MKYLLLLLSFMFVFEARASRLIEIEDYYSEKASDFVKTRYPRKAFSVFVKVDAEESPRFREPASARQQPQLNLPYLDQVSQQQVGFWDRKDISLGTLISYLKSIYLKVDIDGDFSDEEKQKFKSELFQHLKLSEVYDRVEINRRQWQSGFNITNNKPYLFLGLAVLLFLAGTLFFVFQFGVSRLVRGLSKPLSEIGKSAENVANSSSILNEAESSFHMANQRWDESGLTQEKETWAKNEIEKLSSFLADPSGELLQLIENLGAQDPYVMGSLFSEMAIEDLQKLVCWGRGGWWRLAITQMTPLNEKSIGFINQISHLSNREKLLSDGVTVDVKYQNVKRVLARLTEKQFGILLKDCTFDKAELVLRFLPQDTKIRVGKYLYPGEWAKLLEAREMKWEDKYLKEIEEHALQICPLKSESEIHAYFKESDMLKLLDRSNTKDERDIYRVLEKDSWIHTERTPFYEVFSGEEEVLQQLASDLPLELWALAISQCDRDECDNVYKYFTAKQKFILREFKNKFSKAEPEEMALIRAKKKILNSFEFLSEQNSVAELGEADELSA